MNSFAELFGDEISELKNHAKVKIQNGWWINFGVVRRGD